VLLENDLDIHSDSDVFSRAADDIGEDIKLGLFDQLDGGEDEGN
jgi:hypothetical protein